MAGTRVPPQVYHNLIDTVNANLDKLHRYIRLRKKLLGVDELHMYDIYAPMVSGADKVISYQEAKDTVYEALAPWATTTGPSSRRASTTAWIDVRENVGKRSGAYAAGALCHPYVLLNHKDNLDSMFTLAHEMGHAVHSYLSNKNQPPVYRDYVIFVARWPPPANEACSWSTCWPGPPTRRAGLAHQPLPGAVQGHPLPPDHVRRVRAAHGRAQRPGGDPHRRPALQGVQGPEREVLRPRHGLRRRDRHGVGPHPHFYYNYYVYQYATGYSAAIALSRRHPTLR